MPAPVSSSFSIWSNSVTRKPSRASAKAAVNPPIPAPAINMVSEVTSFLVEQAEGSAKSGLVFPGALIKVADPQSTGLGWMQARRVTLRHTGITCEVERAVSYSLGARKGAFRRTSDAGRQGRVEAV